jgi:hypothetical protein
MNPPGYDPYLPQLVPVAQADGIWTVEGPEVAYRLGGIAVPCPTRMTVVRLHDGRLWLHSPVAHSIDLDRALAAFGPVSALVAPNSYHYLGVGGWAAAHPGAGVYAAPGLGDKLGVGSRPLGGEPAEWAGEIDALLVGLGKFSEMVFLHRASRTLIVTDLMQTFEASRVRSGFSRFLLTIGGAMGPNPRPSIEIRRASRGSRNALRAGVRQMIDWDPVRIILSHGPCIQRDAVAAIEQAFTWIE